MRNILSTFDEFVGNEIFSERDLQDYLGRYQDLKDIWRPIGKDSTDINDDIVFEIELIKQVEINIDYILMLVQKYHDSHMQDKEILVTINKAVNASPQLGSKKQLIESFIANIDNSGDVVNEWNEFVEQRREEELEAIIAGERLKPLITRRFLEKAFEDGQIRQTGTDIDKIMPPISRFGCCGNNRAAKKQTVIEKLKVFFEKYFGIGTKFRAVKEEPYQLLFDDLPKVAEKTEI